MHITCVSSSLDAGGAEKNFVWLAEKLKKAGHDVTFFTLRHDVPDFHHLSASITRLRAAPVVSQVCRWYGWRCHLRRISLLRSEILSTLPDVVVSFIDTTNVNVIVALSFTGVPMIVSERIDPRQHTVGRRWRVLRRLTYPRATAVVVQTEAVSKWARSIWPRWEVVRIPNAIVLAKESRGRVPVRPVWFGERNIVAMGRLVPQKGFDMLIEAFVPIAKKYRDWDLTICGDGPLRNELDGRARSLGIGGRVHLPGTIRESAGVIKQAEFFVLSSRYEGFPNALCEAMACGVPVVSFDCPSGPSEIIEHRVNGLLVHPSDIRGLTEAMEMLIESEPLRRRFAKAASVVLARYSEERVFAAWQEVLSRTARGYPSR